MVERNSGEQGFWIKRQLMEILNSRSFRHIDFQMNIDEEREIMNKDKRKHIPLIERWLMDDNPIRIIKTAEQAKEEEAKAEETKKLAKKGEDSKII